MSLLAPAPVPSPTVRPRLAPGPESALPADSLVGRSLAELAALLQIDVPAWRGRDVLDVAAGASSFTAEACARRIQAVALDPHYGAATDALAAQVQLDYAQADARAQSNGHSASPASFTSGDADFDRRAAAQRFLTDYATHYIHNRYVGAALPHLPFFGGTFDLVVCSHLLFVQARRFDFDWHLVACRELARVTADEVRIAPVVTGEGKPFPGLARLRRELKDSGVLSELRSSPAPAAAGTGPVLILRKARP